jgi:hypothetical protein
MSLLTQAQQQALISSSPDTMSWRRRLDQGLNIQPGEGPR